MSETSKSERFQIILTRDELAALDDWRYANRMPTRAAAIRELLRRGMEVRVDYTGTMTIRRSRDVRLVQTQPHGGNDARENGSANGAYGNGYADD